MKPKLIALIISYFIISISFAQLENSELTDIITIEVSYHDNEGNALTVPSGKFWVLNTNGDHGVYAKIEGGRYVEAQSLAGGKIRYIPFIYTSGTQLYFAENGAFPLIQILEYKNPTGYDGTLAIQETTLSQDNLILFPNPTDSQLTINSDEIFKVEVYDLQGRKMFETNSTSIDFTELKTGIYLVNLYDEGDKIVSTYKVIKN
ncbi:T9SS type A sorting domain-containing protein [Lutimonas zeaxanthinifaciens]|uniref:T9SS type A sorting domain-containing protein n=1 Tax=Lutimonas zeaxanthinifaciens TaxID=3060215 RepID=UPI00265D0512|nr:T9SS type A sorting domain-containing protein [Lutimonas sp. YSD2104]WKK66520.1 T9SS type A sorting domain-containing protein [Lutimonas sp. YSD2104]